MWEIRVSVSAQIAISSSVRPVEWDSRASGPRMSNSSWANFTDPRLCPSWVNRRLCRFDISLTARACSFISADSAAESAFWFGVCTGYARLILMRPSALPCHWSISVWQVSIC